MVECKNCETFKNCICVTCCEIQTCDKVCRETTSCRDFQVEYIENKRLDGYENKK